MTSEILSYIYYLVLIILDIFSAFKSSQKTVWWHWSEGEEAAICWMDCSLHIYYVTGKFIITTNQPDVVIRFLMPGCVCYATKKANLFLIPFANVNANLFSSVFRKAAESWTNSCWSLQELLSQKPRQMNILDQSTQKTKLFLHCGFCTPLFQSLRLLSETEQ